MTQQEMQNEIRRYHTEPQTEVIRVSVERVTKDEESSTVWKLGQVRAHIDKSWTNHQIKAEVARMMDDLTRRLQKPYCYYMAVTQHTEKGKSE